MTRNAPLWALAGGALAVILVWSFWPDRERAVPPREAQPGAPPPVESAPPRTMRWQKATTSPPPEGGGIDDEAGTALLEVGYLAAYNAPGDRSGVSPFEPGEVSDGLNLYLSGHAPIALLMDMRGEVLHEWRIDYREAFPDADPSLLEGDGTRYLRRAHLCENGDLIVIFDYCGLVRVDKDSRIVWSHPRSFHHDLFVTGDRIFAISEEQNVVPDVRPEQRVREDFVTVLDMQGTILKNVSILRAFADSEHARVLRWLPGTPDIFHTNTIQILDGSHAARSPAFAAGLALVSLRNLNLIAILDIERETIVWSCAGGWSQQHDPVLLENGRMLIFDNGVRTKASRVIEFDPVDKSIHWTFSGTPEGPFYTRGMGTNQRLANGNTLIVESFNGRVFEVSPDGRVVWRFDNPARAGEQNDLVAVIPDLMRVDRDWTASWLR